MKLNRSQLWIILCCLAFIFYVAPTSQTEEEVEVESKSKSESKEVDARDTDGREAGIFSLLLAPIRATIERAKQLLGQRVDTVNDGIDRVRLQTYTMFMRLYNKTYSPEEIPRRMALYFERLKEIEESVKMFRDGRSMFAMRENAFVDWDERELKKLTGVSVPSNEELTSEELASKTNIGVKYGPDRFVGGPRYKYVDENEEEGEDEDEDENEEGVDFEDRLEEGRMIVKAQIPASKDWRTSGCVSKPINQMKCGACYAIATMGVIESMRCINRVSSPILSPQQIVDCATQRAGYSNFGCEGGWPTRVLRYLQDTGTATRENCYPFVWRQNSCRLQQMRASPGCTLSASPTDTRLQYKVLRNERDILYHVANTGPVVTVMKATNKFLYYSVGIFDDYSCSKRRDDVDHAIVIVGYGSENGNDFWIVKNSWGTSWGQGGYGKYRRGTNACSIGHWGWVVTS